MDYCDSQQQAESMDMRDMLPSSVIPNSGPHGDSSARALCYWEKLGPRRRRGTTAAKQGPNFMANSALAFSKSRALEY